MYYLSRSLPGAASTILPLSVIASCLCSPLLIGPLTQPGDKVQIPLSQPTMSGHTAQWLIQLNKFDITVVTPRGLHSQVLLNLLT